MIAALYVLENGPYFNVDGVDPWPQSRDARQYAGPWPVVAHPPCERWGRFWSGGPSPLQPRRRLGDDEGCFESAKASVQRWGGVLEHPADSLAWRRFDIARPPRNGGWVPAGLWTDGWTCCVDQGNYGHKASKATWLYVSGISPEALPELRWGRSSATHAVIYGARDLARRRSGLPPEKKLLTKRERKLTPEPFKELLLDLARLCRPG